MWHRKGVQLWKEADRAVDWAKWYSIKKNKINSFMSHYYHTFFVGSTPVITKKPMAGFFSKFWSTCESGGIRAITWLFNSGEIGTETIWKLIGFKIDLLILIFVPELDGLQSPFQWEDMNPAIVRRQFLQFVILVPQRVYRRKFQKNVGKEATLWCHRNTKKWISEEKLNFIYWPDGLLHAERHFEFPGFGFRLHPI